MFNFSLYPLQSPCLSVHTHMFVHMSCKCDFSLTDEVLLMKLYTVAVYNLKMCMEENTPGLKYFKKDY